MERMFSELLWDFCWADLVSAWKEGVEKMIGMFGDMDNGASGRRDSALTVGCSVRWVVVEADVRLQVVYCWRSDHVVHLSSAWYLAGGMKRIGVNFAGSHHCRSMKTAHDSVYCSSSGDHMEYYRPDHEARF
ncbi:hypothetical protein Salat_1897400 [Sesamum alatum]|uniref:Uncharacterized protein n=1 Tax=Sesamum alatum TaxID=300844 RepID=A0AAE1Y4G8_9LAMI|nr:hypothetical protein Salat_1897400 [Sesamum alatum]